MAEAAADPALDQASGDSGGMENPPLTDRLEHMDLDGLPAPQNQMLLGERGRNFMGNLGAAVEPGSPPSRFHFSNQAPASEDPPNDGST